MPGGVDQRRHGFGYRPSPEHAGPGLQASVSAARGRPGRAPIAVALRWGAAGFLLGAAFWVYLGVRELTHSDLPKLFQHQGLPAAPASGCTALALDRDNGHTTAAPCASPPSLRDQLTALLGQASRP